MCVSPCPVDERLVLAMALCSTPFAPKLFSGNEPGGDRGACDAEAFVERTGSSRERVAGVTAAAAEPGTEGAA